MEICVLLLLPIHSQIPIQNCCQKLGVSQILVMLATFSILFMLGFDRGSRLKTSRCITCSFLVFCCACPNFLASCAQQPERQISRDLKNTPLLYYKPITSAKFLELSSQNKSFVKTRHIRRSHKAKQVTHQNLQPPLSRRYFFYQDEYS